MKSKHGLYSYGDGDDIYFIFDMFLRRYTFFIKSDAKTIIVLALKNKLQIYLITSGYKISDWQKNRWWVHSEKLKYICGPHSIANRLALELL